MVAVTLSACTGSGGKKKAPDVSDVKVSLQTSRFDRDFVKVDTNNIMGGLQQLHTQYPDFLNFYTDTLMHWGSIYRPDTALQNAVHHFLTYKDYTGLYDTVQAHFPDTKKLDAELTQGFKYMKHYYPSYQVPKVVYFVSGLNFWSAVSYGNIMGIGLDMYLGQDYPFYASIQIPEYMTPRLDPAYVTTNVFKVIQQDYYPFTAEGRNLLDMMLQKGKQLYFLDLMLPETEDSIKIGFSAQQIDWCRKNESQVWNFFIEQKMLYDTDWQKVLRYITDGPSSTGMPPESPGNIGSWLGWQIVRQYMAKNPDTQIEQLMKMNDAMALLKDAGYKP
jgi:hypothetical protein